MTEVVSIKFKNRGKPYFFDPAGLELEVGEHVLVDTAGGMEMGVVSRENHAVEDTAVVQPLRRVLRKATQMDLRTEDLIRQREESAMKICREKIAEHKLDMKLVDVECNFEGSKTTFFFTSDGRVDFRALVKDLAAVLHTRIELRQIGVRDEAKMLGGLGICGRPYCCSQFLDDFRPVSTKMAKVQSLSLNPAKISGSCGRLLCCLRYEQEAYEDLVKKVPKQGAFVETKDGYGTAVQVNLLRSTVKVRLDDDRDDVLHEYQANELAAVPGDFTGSEFVKRTVGVDNVCERAALAEGGVLIARKRAGEGVTVALAVRGVRETEEAKGDVAEKGSFVAERSEISSKKRNNAQ